MPRRSDPGRGRILPDELARRALDEDRFRDDVTSRAIVPARERAVGVVVAQAAGVLSGVVVALAIARAAGLRATVLRRDGERMLRGTRVLRLTGPARALLASERTVLNALMHASGVATATARAVRAATPLEVWATRKTLPGLRDLEKDAVVHGGGHAHRRDLSDQILVKNNHLALVPLAGAIDRARAAAGRRARVEVEVRSAVQAVEAARAGADALLIDNASPARARGIVRALERAGLRSGRWIELSGGITPDTVRRYRTVGADAASLGSLTHSAAALPFHLVIAPARLSRGRP
jgi:nicotinate-nucleotide pyrophosphorylase (carboxylating)